MAVKLRLMRMGKMKQPTYRLVAADSRSPRNGRFIELLGTYEPRKEPSAFDVDEAKVNKWLNQGAQPTETVQKLFVAAGLLTKDAAANTVVGRKQAKRPVKQKKAAPAAESSAAKSGEASATDATAEAPSTKEDA